MRNLISMAGEYLEIKTMARITCAFFCEHTHVLLALFPFHFRPKYILVFAQHFEDFHLDEDQFS